MPLSLTVQMVCLRSLPRHYTLGMSVAEATTIATKRLNEHPSVVSMTFEEAMSDSTLERVQSVIWGSHLNQVDMSDMLNISTKCRDKGKSFLLVVDSCCVNWMFSDFGKVHLVESHTPPLKRDDRTGERKAENKIEEYEFATLKEYIGCNVEDNLVNSKTSFPRTQALFMKLLLEWLYREERGQTLAPSPKRARRSTSPSRNGEDLSFDSYVKERVEELTNAPGRVGKFFSTNRPNVVSDMIEMFSRFMTQKESLPHMAAIHAALVTQEVIKFITRRDPPLVNQIVMNPIDCGAIVMRTPVSLQSRVISSGREEDDGDVELVDSNNVDVLE